jgi:hypothetical protein
VSCLCQWTSALTRADTHNVLAEYRTVPPDANPTSMMADKSAARSEVTDILRETDDQIPAERMNVASRAEMSVETAAAREVSGATTMKDTDSELQVDTEIHVSEPNITEPCGVPSTYIDDQDVRSSFMTVSGSCLIIT